MAGWLGWAVNHFLRVWWKRSTFPVVVGWFGRVCLKEYVVNYPYSTYTGYVKRDLVTGRRTPASLAGVLQELELRQPRVVTGNLLADVITESRSHLTTAAAAERLVREGWLSPLRTRDAWEFVPASRAGRYPSGDPWIELRALLAHEPASPVAIAFASAVWELGHSTHQPVRSVLAHEPGWRPARALSRARSVSYIWRLPTWQKDGLPVWQSATVVVASASRPECQDNWANADDWLPETMRAATPADILAEAAGRTTASTVRLAYFAEWSGRHDIVEVLGPLLPEQLPVTFLGPREPLGRWVKRWRLYDSLLPAR